MRYYAHYNKGPGTEGTGYEAVGASALVPAAVAGVQFLYGTAYWSANKKGVRPFS